MAELTHTQTPSERVFGKEASSNNGKSPSEEDAGTSPLCPQCGSKKLWRDGLRYSIFGDEIQRWLCRDCGMRFSDPQDVQKAWSTFERLERIESKSLRSGDDIVASSQICVSETKNLVALEEPLVRTSAGAPQSRKNPIGRCNPLISGEVRALVTVYRSWLEKEGYTKDSHYPNNLIRLAGLGADLHDPESVKVVIGKLDVRNGTKLQYVYAYDAFAVMLKISWEPPWYKQEEMIPFVPEESELDSLIASCRSRRMAGYLQCLKETFVDPGEALRIRWKDISGNIVTINFPVKGHLPRQLEVSNKLLAMLNCLPRKSERVFPVSYSSLFSCYDRVRKRAAEVQKNPRLLHVELRSFRHWGGTMLAYYTGGNVLIVKRLLGHKRVENTMKYIGMIHFKNNEFEVATATTVEEAKQILSAGFEYITEKNGIMLFRRPKRFANLQNLEDKRRSTMINLK